MCTKSNSFSRNSIVCPTSPTSIQYQLASEILKKTEQQQRGHKLEAPDSADTISHRVVLDVSGGGNQIDIESFPSIPKRSKISLRCGCDCRIGMGESILPIAGMLIEYQPAIASWFWILSACFYRPDRVNIRAAISPDQSNNNKTLMSLE